MAKDICTIKHLWIQTDIDSWSGSLFASCLTCWERPLIVNILKLYKTFEGFFFLPRWLWFPGELFQAPDIHVAKIIFRNYINEGAVVQVYLHPSSEEHSHQKSGALNWNFVRMCPVPPLWWCADQTAQTFSIEELTRWRAETTRHHALQAPTDRLPIASRCALHPSCALSCLFWVRFFF